MKAYDIIDKLERHIPLFTKRVDPWKKRIIGIETELGVMEITNGQSDSLYEVQDALLPRWTRNGGRIYFDQDRHIEPCSPETSNPLDAVLYTESMLAEASKLRLSPILYANNRDAYSNTFGRHENYFVRSKETGKDFFKLIPFLVVRTLLNGSGFLQDDGGYLISQRAGFMERAIAEDHSTTSNRGLVGTRIHDHRSTDPELADYCCLHLTCGDTNRAQIASFLTVGLTAMVIELYEDNLLPKVRYEINGSTDDLDLISNFSSRWLTHDIGKFEDLVIQDSYQPITALELLRIYLDQIKRYYEGKDDIVDALIYIGFDTLHKLETKPWSLAGRLDWVTKLRLLRHLYENGEKDIDILHMNDVAYHRLDREYSLYKHLEDRGYMELLFTRSMLRKARRNPPPDTRAYLRGCLVKADLRKVIDARDKEWRRLQYDVGGGDLSLLVEMPDPFNNYSTELTYHLDRIQ